MALIRGAPVIRNLLGRPIALHRTVQKRWAQVHDVRFVASHASGAEKVQDRYREKLEQKAKQEGHESISSLKKAYEEKINDVRATESATIAQAPNPSSPSPAQSPNNAPPPSSAAAASTASSIPKSSSTPGIKSLSSYLDIPKILTLPKKEIETLWRLRHAHNPLSICATIPLSTYERMASVARQNPQFVLPLPRTADSPVPPPEEVGQAEGGEKKKGTGADIHFLQWGFHPPSPSPSPQPTTTEKTQTANTHTSTVIFTHLAAYKLHGAYSPPHTIITHHLDLADSKGLVLMNGSVVADRGVSVEEAKWLVMWLQRFYDWGSSSEDDGKGGRKGEMLRMFTRGDTKGFRLEELLEEVEKV
ncbi:hypothetical protein AJ80_00468 [Polytolypa hystricis UAMH7299]|uniref:ATP synthase mitochondrial F1 complex assembly factor 1 n=1 Tax=Polytolypa hystricis (strain UAMH7299) TaxID=1447883 RepID=A0A2B7Z464_POLH7|nr:hypothetical protein AJ80_00468 [Polytolypa hystricis UAMH7299]